MNSLATLHADGLADALTDYIRLQDAFGGRRFTTQGRVWAERALAITQDEAPRSDDEDGDTDPQHLVDDLRVLRYSAYQGRLDAEIGAVGRGATLLPLVLYPTRPHDIESKRPGGMLRFPARGGGYQFAGVVHHPGTKGNRFDLRAQDRIHKELELDMLRYVARAAAR